MTDAQIIGTLLGAEADKRGFCTEWDAIIVELNRQLVEPLPHRFKPTRAFREWSDRVTEDVWLKSWIMQWYSHIEPRAQGYGGHGKKSALTDHEVGVLATVLGRRIDFDRAPLVTAEQADQGAKWLDANWKRQKLPELNYLAIRHFEFRGTELAHEHHSAYGSHVTYVPKYRAIWPDGTQFTYAVGSWQSDRERAVRWSGRLADGEYIHREAA